MLIRFVCAGQPVPFVPTRVYEGGCGGAELALHHITREMVLRGHDVEVYIPTGGDDGWYDSVKYSNLDTFDSKQNVTADITVFFRNVYKGRVATKQHVFFSCDQYTVSDEQWLDFFREKEPINVMAISRYHKQYLEHRYKLHSDRVKVVYLGVNVDDYGLNYQKKRWSMLWCSQIDRGLGHLMNMWKMIKKELPSATLTVTGNRSLWGPHDNTAQYHDVARELDVKYVGAVSRSELIKLQLESEVFPFSCSYHENFCLAAAESMAAGCVLVTTGNIGAVNEVVGETGILVDLQFENENAFEIVADRYTSAQWGPYYNLFTNGLANLMKDHGQVLRLSEMARARIRNHFTYKNTVDRFFAAL